MGNACKSPGGGDEAAAEPPTWAAIEAKMKASKCSEAAIAAFKYNYCYFTSGNSTMITEEQITGVEKLDDAEAFTDEKAEYLKETVIIKLNGGLGTGMGLSKAKSLLPVQGGDTFLDLIAQQVANMKKTLSADDLKFMLMNSFSTSDDTIEYLAKYPELGAREDLEFLQNKAPKIIEEGDKKFEAVTWEKEPDQEWCPPGHGDLYPAFLGSGALQKLLDAGKKYAFVSNSDNLGATMDLKILTYFVESKAPFMMECADRTNADKKGGHLCEGVGENAGRLGLRELAQINEDDKAWAEAFQDTGKYKYFNTNNLWIDLQALKATMEKNGGVLLLPVMSNKKTVDPRDKASTKVIQLETAMGAAIQCFDGAKAIRVPRTRFAPVKTCNDLLVLRSNATIRTEDLRLELHADRKGVPPEVKLDGIHKFVDGMEKFAPPGSEPELKDCDKLVVVGDVRCEPGVIFKGSVKVTASETKTLAAGEYTGDVNL